MDPSNQTRGSWNISEKSRMMQTPPPAYQDIPTGYPSSFPSQPVPQGPYTQGPYPGQPVVSMQTPPPAYQDIPTGYPSSCPSQPVPQGPYSQGSYPGQPVVSMQPTIIVTSAPLEKPDPDFLWYSIFNMLCCCLPLGIAALIYSVSTRYANHAGQQVLAAKYSKTARILNHIGVAIGVVFIVLFIVLQVVAFKNS